MHGHANICVVISACAHIVQLFLWQLNETQFLHSTCGINVELETIACLSSRRPS